MSRSTDDPRIANILARLDDWKDHYDDREAGRYVSLLAEHIDWEGMKHEQLRSVLVALLEAADESVLEDLDSVATGDRTTFLQCTIGNDIGKALQKVGLNPAQAESIAHEAIAKALEKATVAA